MADMQSGQDCLYHLNLRGREDSKTKGYLAFISYICREIDCGMGVKPQDRKQIGKIYGT